MRAEHPHEEQQAPLADAQVPISHADRLASSAARHPDRAGIVFARASGEESRLTYADLEALADTLAATMQAHGVDRTSLVAFSLPTSLHLVAGMYAAWKLGACVLPLSPTLSRYERESI